MKSPWAGQGMGLSSMRPQAVPAMHSLPAAAIPQVKKQIRANAMGLGGMSQAQAAQARRNRGFQAQQPARAVPAPMSDPSMPITTVQGSEIGRPDIAGPLVLVDKGQGQYAATRGVGTITGDYGKYFT